MRFGPWHVKGVHPEARDSAREAARRAGMSVGEWLNSVILDTPPEYEQPPHTQPDPYAPPAHRARQQRPAPPPADQVAREIAALNRRVEGWASGFETLARAGNTGRAISAESDPTARRLADALSRLDKRIDHLAREGRTASKALERRVESVDRALSALGHSRVRAASSNWPAGIDDAVAEITQRQRELDDAPMGFARPTTPPPRVYDD